MSPLQATTGASSAHRNSSWVSCPCSCSLASTDWRASRKVGRVTLSARHRERRHWPSYSRPHAQPDFESGRLILQNSTVYCRNTRPKPREIWALAFQGWRNDKQTHSLLSGLQQCRTANVSARRSTTCVSQGDHLMNRSRTTDAGTRTHWFGLALLTISSALFAGQVSALTLSPTKVTVSAGGSTAVKISSARGEIQAESKNTAVVKVSLSNVTTTSATLTVYGVSAGSATVYVRDARTSNISLPVTVVKAMTVSPTSLSLAVGASGKITASSYSGACQRPRRAPASPQSRSAATS